MDKKLPRVKWNKELLKKLAEASNVSEKTIKKYAKILLELDKK